MNKVAVVVSHPIQHFCPQYSSWAKIPDIDIFVFFASNHGLKPYKDRDFDRMVQWEGMKLDFPHTFLPDADGRAVNSKIDSGELETELEAFDPDLLIIYGYSQRLQRRALKWTDRSAVPVAMISDAELRTKRSFIKTALKSVLIPKLLRHVNLFLTVGDANEAYYRHYGVSDDQFVRCFFPIDHNHYDDVVAEHSSARNRVRTTLGIPLHHKVILSVGKLVPWKCQKDLVKFSNRIQVQRDDITVILAGTGRDDENLRKLCQRDGPGGVIFAGFVVPDILAEYYCTADVYTHCSQQEPHSLAISEAIYCGLPIVISDRCGSYGPSDDVRHGLNGLVYQCGNIDDLSMRLLYILDNNELLKKMSEVSKRISRYHQSLAHGKALKQALVIIDADT